tara:strand:+ start:1306 stop:2019 length:714 start_codon:yes stop_codon:yes gene_type:complete
MFAEDIVKYAKASPGEECCGFVLLNENLEVVVEPCINESSTPKDCFSISPSKFIDYTLTKKILGIYHSHPFSEERPSTHDIKASEESGIPYIIYSLKTKKKFLYYPESYQPVPLLQRPYVPGFYECTSLMKDYFKKELELSIVKWNKNYWLPEDDSKANELLSKIFSKELKEINPKKVKKHDVIVFQIKNHARFHVGMYCGKDEFMHQPAPLLSRKEVLDERWQKKIKRVYRHPDLV